MSSSPAELPAPEGPGSVSGAPNLPQGFTSTFTSRYVDTGGLRQHVVTGGEGPPLLLVHGWPQTWYAWRLVMLALARDFFVVAPDQRGTGLSGKPQDGYDTGTLAGDLVALMDALGHQRFAMAGHDTGMWIGYALAADHPGRLARLAVAETPLPGLSPSPPLFASAHLNNALWHFAFNRLAEVNDQLVTGREDIYFGWQFAAKAARKLPDYAVRHYVDTLASGPEALHASFAIYRALDATIAQNQQRKGRRLTLPILAIGGAHSLGDQVADTMKLAADDVQTLVIPGCAHWIAEETPQETVAALTAFLAPYRDETGHAARPLSGEELLMSIKGKVLAEAGTPAYVTRFDGVRVPATDYHPVWLDSLASDATIEGSAMNGLVQGADAIRSIVTYIRTLYDDQEFNFAGPYGENGFLEDYAARVRGAQIGNVVLVTRNAAGQAQHIVANYRPRSTLLLLSRLIGEHFAGSPYGEHFASSSPE